MTQTIAISDTLQFYVASNANANAVDSILSIKEQSSYTSGMTWEEIQSLNDARMAAFKVQVDYWELLHHVWESTWGSVLSELSGKVSEVDMSAYGNDRSLKATWDNGSLTKQFVLRDGALYLRVYTGDDFDLALAFYFEDGEDQNYDLSNSLKLSADWKPDAEDDERVTRGKLLPLKKQIEVDILPLQRLAKEAIEKLLMQAGLGSMVG